MERLLGKLKNKILVRVDNRSKTEKIKVLNYSGFDRPAAAGTRIMRSWF